VVAATEFPNEHWTPLGIRAAFHKLGNIIEIDPDCLANDPNDPDCEPADCSSVRVILERHRPGNLPDDIFIGNPDRLGTSFQVQTLRVWPLVE